MLKLREWECKFVEKWPEGDPQKAGFLLTAVPNHLEWDEFLSSVKTEWNTWYSNLQYVPYSLVMLYAGLAFYEYDDNTFWPHFFKAVGTDPFPANRQTEINHSFEEISEELGLKINKRTGHTDYVGSAIWHIGIPLSLWGGFLDICEWALWQDGWKTLSDSEWSDSIKKRTGGRPRLSRFLIDNREVATTFIREMHDAREILIKDSSLTLSDLAQACLTRPEYFEEVPETAEFLRPQNPDSLFSDRACIVWDDNNYCICLHLPGVARNKLPAMWEISSLIQPASTTPDKLDLDSIAFEDSLLLKLKSDNQSEEQRIPGLKPFGLYDLQRNRFINVDRELLPLRSYILISPDKLNIVSRKGFAEEDYPVNETYELKDGATCYITRLWPTDKSASLIMRTEDREQKLYFRTGERIEMLFFVGEGYFSAHFSRVGDGIKIERLPVLCVAIPNGYFKNAEAVVNSEFRVAFDEGNKIQASGRWEKRHTDDEREYYFWKWAEKPTVKASQGQTINLHQLKEKIKEVQEHVKPPDLTGKRIIAIESKKMGSVEKRRPV